MLKIFVYDIVTLHPYIYRRTGYIIKYICREKNILYSTFEIFLLYLQFPVDSQISIDKIGSIWSDYNNNNKISIFYIIVWESICHAFTSLYMYTVFFLYSNILFNISYEFIKFISNYY